MFISRAFSGSLQISSFTFQVKIWNLNHALLFKKLIRCETISSACNLPNKDPVENSTTFDLVYMGFTIQCLHKKKLISRCHGEKNIPEICSKYPNIKLKQHEEETYRCKECISIIAYVVHWILTALPCISVVGTITEFI